MIMAMPIPPPMHMVSNPIAPSVGLGLSLGPLLMGIVVREFGFPVGFGAAATLTLAGAMIVLGPRSSAKAA